MPLPRRVHEVDMGGTRVSPAAYQAPSQPRGYTTTQKKTSITQPPPASPRRTWSCLVYGLIGLFFLGVLGALIAVSIAVFSYYSIARTLPDVD